MVFCKSANGISHGKQSAFPRFLLQSRLSLLLLQCCCTSKRFYVAHTTIRFSSISFILFIRTNLSSFFFVVVGFVVVAAAVALLFCCSILIRRAFSWSQPNAWMFNKTQTNYHQIKTKRKYAIFFLFSVLVLILLFFGFISAALFHLVRF